MCDSMFILVIASFFFFKQKTAYEMRISDWSSDVCSSDLPHHPGAGPAAAQSGRTPGRQRPRRAGGGRRLVGGTLLAGPPDRRRQTAGPRSAEHPSELQSLMRTSYAVFCLKKKRTSIAADKLSSLAHTKYEPREIIRNNT